MPSMNEEKWCADWKWGCSLQGRGELSVLGTVGDRVCGGVRWVLGSLMPGLLLCICVCLSVMLKNQFSTE